MSSLQSPAGASHRFKWVCAAAWVLVTLWHPLVISHAEEAHRDQDPGHDPIHHVHGSHAECPLPKMPMDILRCAQEEHPAVKRAKLAAEVSGTLLDVASQFPNPEFETQTVFGNTQGERQMQSQISLTQPIGLGGGRGARKQGAQAQKAQAEAELKAVKADVTLETVSKLHRLRQIEAEKAILEEAVSSYAKLLSQFRSRPRLTPEQEVSQSVYEMAHSDNKIRVSLLADEEREIEHFFHISTGHGRSEIEKALPSAPKSWPRVESRRKDLASSPGIFRLLADQSVAEAELESARAASWPGLRMGPMLQLENNGSTQNKLFGFQLNLELPILSLNGGARDHASKELWKAEQSIALLKSEEAHEREEQVRIYGGALEVLQAVGSSAALEQKHQRVETLSMRGLIPSSLVIEAHRQRAELEKSRNERELRAIQALWTIYKLDGRIFEEAI